MSSLKVGICSHHMGELNGTFKMGICLLLMLSSDSTICQANVSRWSEIDKFCPEQHTL